MSTCSFFITVNKNVSNSRAVQILPILGLGDSIVTRILSKNPNFKSNGCGHMSGLRAVFKRRTHRRDKSSPGLLAGGLAGFGGVGSFTLNKNIIKLDCTVLIKKKFN